MTFLQSKKNELKERHCLFFQERRKFEIERESIQQKTEKELNELRTNIERLQKVFLRSHDQQEKSFRFV